MLTDLTCPVSWAAFGPEDINGEPPRFQKPVHFLRPPIPLSHVPCIQCQPSPRSFCGQETESTGESSGFVLPLAIVGYA